METSTNKIFTILVGEGIELGDCFSVAGRAGSLKEARHMCREASFIREHVAPKSDGAYVLIVSNTGHNIFIPIQSLLAREGIASVR